MILKIAAVTGISIALGIVCGSGCVYAFNHIPDEWLGADEEGREWQRVKSVPWKYIFTAAFIVVGIYLGMADVQMAPGIYAAVLILTEIAMAALLYDRIPRPLVWLLALTGIGIIPFTIGEDLGFGPGTIGMLKAHLTGAAIGFAVLLVLEIIKMRDSKASVSRALVVRRKKPYWVQCELGLVLGLITGPIKVSLIIVTGAMVWGGYVIFGYKNRINRNVKKQIGTIKKETHSGVLRKQKIGDAFFLCVSAIFWMIIYTPL